MKFIDFVTEGFKEPQKQWKNKSVKINGKVTGICYDATIYGDQIIIILKKDTGDFEAFTFDKNNYDMKISVSDDDIVKILKKSQSKIKKTNTIENVKEFDIKGKDMIISIDVIERPYSLGEIIDYPKNKKKLYDFYSEVKEILNNNSLGVVFDVKHYTTGDKAKVYVIE